jgi:hypothetical protein
MAGFCFLTSGPGQKLDWKILCKGLPYKISKGNYYFGDMEKII